MISYRNSLYSKQNSFLFGVSTSSYQTEGQINNNDWNYFAETSKIKERISKMTTPNFLYKWTNTISLKPSNDAVKFWDPKYYENDIKLVKDMGMNAFRISIEWSRIQPNKENEWNYDAIQHYKNIIKTMRHNNIIPIITLNHFTLPLWVLTPPKEFSKKIGQQVLPSPLNIIPLGEPKKNDPYWNSLGGWENEETVNRFVDFVEKIVYEFKEFVDFWITINEPVSSIIGGGYISGIWPPGFFLDGKRAKKSLHNLIVAHVRTYDKIKLIDDVDGDGDNVNSCVGIAHSMFAVRPIDKNKNNSKNIEAAKNFSYFINDYFLNAIVDGVEDKNYLNTLQRYNQDSSDFLIHREWKNKSDFIGINYYRRLYVYNSQILNLSSASFVGAAAINDLRKYDGNHGVLNDLGWEIYPKGLYEIISKLHNKWNIPILITENGIADKNNEYRSKFIIAHLKQIKKNIEEKVNIIGYLYWSLMDNYEWQEGYN
ncbi:MAG: glycoside hydrolase family 1 protein, partial [Nitrososphaeraceae archaeon]